MPWAQLLGGVPSPYPDLKRGFWYPVEGYPPGGLVRVIGPHGLLRPIDKTMVRTRERKPSAITRVPDAAFDVDEPGELSPGVTYHGVCPEGHRIDGLRGTESHHACVTCEIEYPVEDEGPWFLTNVPSTYPRDPKTP
jgi:hypothetical protein